MAFVASTGAAAVSPRNSSRAVCERTSSFTGATAIRTTRAAAPAHSTTRQSPRMEFGKTVKETLLSNPNFSILVQLASIAGVDMELSNCTVFAPNNDSFQRLRPGYLEELMANPDAAKSTILRHVLPGRVLTSRQIRGCGFWEDVWGGRLGYQGIEKIVRVGGARILNESCDLECDNGTIHTIDTLIPTPLYQPQGLAKSYIPSIPAFGDSTVAATYPSSMSSVTQQRAVGACLPSTVGGRKAMGLIDQLPFWQYGPPYNAAKQEDLEPISIAEGDVTKGIDYQLMPAGSVIVTPDEVSAAKLLPVSGLSKYIGKTKRLVEGDGQSTYSRLDDLDLAE